MRYDSFIAILKNVPDQAESHATWEWIRGSIAPVQSPWARLSAKFQLYSPLIPIFATALVIVVALSTHYIQESRVQALMQFSSSTEYIYTLCKY